MLLNLQSINFLKSISEKVPKAIKEIVIKGDNYLILHVNHDFFFPFFLFLKKHVSVQFGLLMDITAVDYPKNHQRFVVIYQMLSVIYNQRLSIKLSIDKNMVVPSLTAIYKSAGWLEREIWDLFGIIFSNHPDLRRILTDYGFQGFPLRKDFPLSGFLELVYLEEEKKVLYLPLEFFQEYRFFDFRNSWY